jgi:hypothetical protein
MFLLAGVGIFPINSVFYDEANKIETILVKFVSFVLSDVLLTVKFTNQK